MLNPVIEINGVTKLYGSTVGVKHISLRVPAGAIFGFLGPNGAGKTTTISMMIDLIRPTSGKITIFGLDSIHYSLDIRKRIGYLDGDFALDENLTGWQQLQYFGNLRGGFKRKSVQELAGRLGAQLDRRFKTLSRGNKQKIGLISALMHDPELLILDEPTSSLDPLVQAEFNKLLLERKNRGQTTFMSSHVLSEVQEVCDQVAFIRSGRLVAISSTRELSSGLPKRVRLSSDDKSLAGALKRLTGVGEVKRVGAGLECTFKGDINALISLLNRHNLSNVNIQDADLETVFMKYYEQTPGAATAVFKRNPNEKQDVF